jgi:hypothetical protein
MDGSHEGEMEGIMDGLRTVEGVCVVIEGGVCDVARVQGARDHGDRDGDREAMMEGRPVDGADDGKSDPAAEDV